MRLLFLGCSWTWGCEIAVGKSMLEKIKEKRFSSIIGRRLDAEVVNLAENGFSNHAIARIFLEQDLESFDKIFVQLTYPSRTEWYDPTGMFNKVKLLAKIKEFPNKREKWLKRLEKKETRLWDRILGGKERFLTTGKVLEGKEWWIHYFEEIYHDEYGLTEEMLFFNLIKNKLKRMSKDHLIFSINPKCKLPIDLQLNLSKYPRAKQNHPNALGHSMIASDIMKLL